MQVEVSRGKKAISMSDDSDNPETSHAIDWQAVVLNGTLTETDILHAYRMAAKSWKRKLWLWISIVIVFILVFVAVAVSTRPYSREASNRILFAVGIFLPAILVFPYIRSRIQLRKLLRTKPDAYHPYETTIDSDGIHTKGETFDARFGWDAFSHYRASDRMCLLYWKDTSNYTMFGRSRFPDGASWDDFIKLVEQQFDPI